MKSTCDKFFSRASLAANENRRAGRGYCLDLLEDVERCFATSDDLAEIVIGTRFLL